MKQLLFTARGRIGRAAYWKGSLLVLLVTMLTALVSVGYGTVVPDMTTADGSHLIEGAVELPLILLSLATFAFDAYASCCLAIKRCHDRDKSGWWSLIQLIPIVGQIWSVVEIGFFAGTPGPNRFGPDPLASNSKPAHLGVV